MTDRHYEAHRKLVLALTKPDGFQGAWPEPVALRREGDLISIMRPENDDPRPEAGPWVWWVRPVLTRFILVGYVDPHRLDTTIDIHRCKEIVWDREACRALRQRRAAASLMSHPSVAPSRRWPTIDGGQ